MKPQAPPDMSRYQLLAALHETLAPVETYLEVGVQFGPSLALAEAAGVAYGIDPNPMVLPEHVRRNQRVRAETSEQFFTCESCERPVIDFAFIDGSHLFEDALRDFVHIQRHSGPHTVVVFDDVLPYSQDIAWRHQPPGDWTGDVFKLPYILNQYQPTLAQILCDVSPTGALIVTGLDPRDTALDRQFEKIVDHYHHGQYRAAPDDVTGSPWRHWNNVPAEVLARTGAVSGHEAVAKIAGMVKRGELAKGKVRA
jgi:hypothetical protein